MGCCVSAELQAQERRSRQIEKNMDQERKKLIKECKILLLGKQHPGNHQRERMDLYHELRKCFYSWQDTKSTSYMPNCSPL